MGAESAEPASTPIGAVFLSYASQDAEAAQKVCAALHAAGIEVFFDQSELRGGDVWDQRIRREIDDCALFIPIVSRHTQERLEGYFRHEWKLAIERTHHMAEQKSFLVPVVVDGTGDREAIVPDLFRAVQWTRLPAGETPPAFVERVQRLLSLEGSTPIRRPTGAKSGAVEVIRPTVQAPWSLQRGLLVAVAVILAGAVAYFAIDKLWMSNKRSAPVASAASVTSTRPGSTSVSVPPPHSIAVLAFSDLSAEGNQGYFADGIAEEILNVLAHVNGLKVASRTSSFQFRKSDLGATAIAQKLGVRHVLEGSVRKAGDTVRITAQLIDASTDQHEWSQSFDRPLSTANLFAIQDEIAKSIVEHLAATVGGAVEIGRPVSRKADTTDEDAYDLYLKGRALFIARNKANLRSAIAPLKAAVAKDPKFSRAWEMLGAVLMAGQSWDAIDATESQAGVDAIETALRLDPSLSLAYAVRGSAQVEFDNVARRGAVAWDDSNDSYSRAIANDATDATAYAWRAQNYMDLGYFDRALSDNQRCLDIDPAYELCRRYLAMNSLYLGKTDAALRLLETGLENGYLFADVTFVTAVAARGDRVGALDILARQFQDDPQLIRPLFRAVTDRTFNDRDRQDAVALVKHAKNSLTFVPSALLLLKAYEEITSSDTVPPIWWARDDAWLKSQSRKRLMRSWQLPEYWAKHGFPPQCRPVGPSDFECR